MRAARSRASRGRLGVLTGAHLRGLRSMNPERAQTRNRANHPSVLLVAESEQCFPNALSREAGAETRVNADGLMFPLGAKEIQLPS